jgi:hypothetical protein
VAAVTRHVLAAGRARRGSLPGMRRGKLGRGRRGGVAGPAMVGAYNRPKGARERRYETRKGSPPVSTGEGDGPRRPYHQLPFLREKNILQYRCSW